MQSKLSMAKMQRSCEDISRVLKSLSHPGRLMILGHLSSGHKTVTQLVELCQLPQSQMSHFLARLNYEGLVNRERDGKFRYYCLADQRLRKLLDVIQREYCGR